MPLTVITGFLGSGKTTLLNQFLKHTTVGEVAVIVNEFGEIGLDHLWVATASEHIVLLERGCVCCSIRSDLVETLVDLAQRQAAGEVPAFGRVVIETTGLADPAPMLYAMMTHPLTVAHYYIDAVITTVDAVLASWQMLQYPQVIKQIALADRLLLTKTDLVEPASLVELQKQLLRYNAHARIEYVLPHQGINPALILETGCQAWLQTPALCSEFAETTGAEVHAPIQSFCFIRDVPISRAVLGLWLFELARDCGQQLLRLKGLVQLSDYSGALMIQGVQYRIYPPVHLAQWPSADQRTRIIFIMQDFTLQQIEGRYAEVCQRLAV